MYLAFMWFGEMSELILYTQVVAATQIKRYVLNMEGSVLDRTQRRCQP